MNEPQLNEHNKAEYPPMHTAEHLLNRTMVRMFGCERSRSFSLPEEPSAEKVQEIVDTMNRLIADDLPVTYEYVSLSEVPDEVKTDRLPENASETLRLVRIGNYDVCPCIGAHVKSTGELGEFLLLGTNWDAERQNFRIRFKLAVREA